jgi:hypothetical protein
MNIYEVSFTGRPIDSIGVFRNCTVEVSAEDEKHAVKKVYETHDHLMFIKVKQVGDETL